MEEDLSGAYFPYIDGTPVAYHQTDMEGYVGPVAIEDVVADQSYIQWPDGTGVSLQLHHPDDWRNGGGGAYDFYLKMQRLAQAALIAADTDKLDDYAHDLEPETFRPIFPQEEPRQE